MNTNKMSAYELNEKLELWKIDNWDKDPRYKCPVPIKWPKLGIPTVYIASHNGSIHEIKRNYVGKYKRRHFTWRPWRATKETFIYPE